MTNETLNYLSVCPHDTAKNQVSWFTFNTYLQRKLDVRLRFEPKDSILAEREAVLASPHHVVYANPFSACRFASQGYIPVARPAGLNDEALLVCLDETDPAQLARPVKIASASDQIIIHHLGLTLLDALDLSAGDTEFDFCGNHMNAVKALINRSAQMAFVFNETWNGLNATTRGGLKVVKETTGGAAFHCFMVGPEWQDKAAAVQAVLCGMADDPAGKSILDELGFQGLEAIDSHALDKLQKLMS